jgi:hypothetical protein
VTEKGFSPPQATPFQRQWSGVCGLSQESRSIAVSAGVRQNP